MRTLIFGFARKAPARYPAIQLSTDGSFCPPTALSTWRPPFCFAISACEVADEVTGLLGLEREPGGVLRLVGERDLREVDDREVHVRELPRSGVQVSGEQEAVGDDDAAVASFVRRRGDVLQVVRRRLRDEGTCRHPELLLRPETAFVRQEVERAVVQPGRVADDRAVVPVGRRPRAPSSRARAKLRAQRRSRRYAYFHVPSLRNRPAALVGRLI